MDKRHQKKASQDKVKLHAKRLAALLLGGVCMLATGHDGRTHRDADSTHATHPAGFVARMAHTETHAHPFSLAAFFERRTVTFDNFPMDPVQEIAKTVADNLQPVINDRIHVVKVNRKERSPLLAVTSAKDMCIVVLNTNPDGWAVWTRFIDGLDDEQRKGIVELAVAHEIGHCMEVQNARAHKEEPGTPSTHALSGPSETYADLFAGAYAHLHMGDRANAPIEHFIRVRSQFAGSEPTHDTATPLQALWKRLHSEPAAMQASQMVSNPHLLITGAAL